MGKGESISASGTSRNRERESEAHIIGTCSGSEIWHRVVIAVEFFRCWVRVRFHRSGGDEKAEGANNKQRVLVSSEMLGLTVL